MSASLQRSLPKRPVRVDKRDVYQYALKCVILTTQDITASSAPPPPAASQNHMSHLQNMIHSSTHHSKDRDSSSAITQSTKFPKDLQRLLIRRLSSIGTGSLPRTLDTKDPAILKFLAYFGEKVLNDKSFREKKKDCTTADLLSEYVKNVVLVAGQKTPQSYGPYLRALRQVIGDVLKYDAGNMHGVNADAIVNEIEKFENHIVGPPKNSSNRPTSSETPNVLNQSPMNSAKVNSPIADSEGLLEWLRAVLEIPPEEHQATIQKIRSRCTQQTAFDDVKLCLSTLDRDVHPSGRMHDFVDASAYEAWKKRERLMLNQTVLTMAAANPEFAARPTIDLPAGLLHQLQEDRQAQMEGRPRSGNYSSSYTSPFTYIPNDPREYYKFLLCACLDLELKSGVTEGKFLGVKSIGILKECGLRWRLVPIFRVIAILDAIRERFDASILTVDHVREAFIQLEKEIKKNAAGDGGVGGERRFLYQVYAALNRSMMQALINDLSQYQRMSQEDIEPVLLILEDVHSDPVFRQAHPEVDNAVVELTAAIKEAAQGVFQTISKDFSELSDLARMAAIADQIIAVTKNTGKRFPQLLLGEIDVAGAAFEVLLNNYVIRVEYLLRDDFFQQNDHEGRPTDEAFNLYKSSRALYRMYLKTGADMQLDADFNVCKWFLPQILGWLRVTETLTSKWVTGAIKVDNLEPISEESKHSSSVLDLFACFQQQLDFLDSYVWPDEKQRCQFLTQLGRTFGQAVEQYCVIMEDLFRADLYPVTSTVTQEPSNANLGWFGTAKVFGYSSRPTSKAPEPINLQPEARKSYIITCIKMNNVEAMLYQLDELYSKLNGDEIGEMIEGIEELNLNSTSPDAPPPPKKPVYLYSVKVVQAEGLRAMDSNNLSDPYVILISGQTELARTRVIYETLDPRWEEVFEIRLEIPIIVKAVVFDRDTLGKDRVIGITSFQLQPVLYNDFLSHDLWLDLDTQGRLLIRISMEGERNDIRFHFGKAFRTLKRTQTEMSRLIIEQMNGYIRHCLSRNELFKTLRAKNSGGFFRTGAREHASREECDQALIPLIEYLDLNLSTLFTNLREDVAQLVFSHLWKDILSIIESILVPPLSDTQSNMIPLDEYELNMTFGCLELLKIYFNGGDDQDGIPMKMLENQRYRNLLAIRNYYMMPTEELVKAFQKAVEAEKTRKEKSGVKKSKSLMNRSNLGTLKKREEKKLSELVETSECILRTMRMRKECARLLPELVGARSRRSYRDAKALPALPPEEEE